MLTESQNAIDLFLDALWLEDGLSRNTLAAYRRDLAAYAGWLAAQQPPLALEIDGIGHLQVERWYDDLLRAAELMASGGTEGPLIRLPAIACRTEPERVAGIRRVLLAPGVRTSTLTQGTGV